MASYQDIDSRLRTVEDKLDFIMSQFKVTKRSQSIVDPTKTVIETMDLAQLYKEIKTQSLLVEGVNG